MLEYSAVLGNDLRAWLGNIHYLLDAIRNSPYFWPGVLGIAGALVLAARVLLK